MEEIKRSVSANDRIVSYDIDTWMPQLSATQARGITEELENGQVILLPNLTMSNATDSLLFQTGVVGAKRKNISYDYAKGLMKGLDPSYTGGAQIKKLLHDYALNTQALVNRLFPHYQSHLRLGRTSYRPVEIKDRKTSYRKDDTRLHVDAFPSSPVQGQRILRVFCNINPVGAPRVWRLGEPLANVLAKFLPEIKKPFPLKHQAMQWLGLTKQKRSDYDHYMLQVHHRMKADMLYQQTADQVTVDMPAQATWMVFTDQASHAAIAGCFLLEQTFYLSPSVQLQPEKSPLYRLRAALGKSLLDA